MLLLSAECCCLFLSDAQIWIICDDDIETEAKEATDPIKTSTQLTLAAPVALYMMKLYCESIFSSDFEIYAYTYKYK